MRSLIRVLNMPGYWGALARSTTPLRKRQVLPILVAMTGLMPLTGSLSTAQAAEVVSPTGDTAVAVRTTDGSSEPMQYVIENKGSSIKFEDASLGLGEEGVVQTDVFEIEVTGASETVAVTTKAATASDTSQVTPGTSKLDALGFRVTLHEVTGDTYTFHVRSVDVDHALSHVTFQFNDESGGHDDSPGDDDSNGSNDDSSGTVTDAEYTRVVYGINGETGELRRYDFSPSEGESAAMSLGTVEGPSGQTLTPIDAGAFMPGLSNMFAFYQQPMEGNDGKQTRLVYISLMPPSESEREAGATAEAGFVGEPLGAGEITGAAMVGSALYAVQRPPQIEFDIEGDTVVTREAVSAKVQVLGAAITAGGGKYHVPVTMRVNANGTTRHPFGEFEDVGDGNVNDQQNPRQFVLPDTFTAGSSINIRARSWLKDWHRHGRRWRHRWDEYLTVASEQDSENLIVLRDGDPVPDIEPLRDQNTIASFVSDYVDASSNTMSLQKNQAIYLYELGTTNVNTSAADFQDLVVLVTLAREADTLDTEGAASAGAKLVRIDAKQGKMEDTVMPLQHGYDSLAHSHDMVFYGTKGDSVYRINAAAGEMSETRVEQFDGADMRALAFGGSKLSSFEQAQMQALWPTDPDVLQAVGGAQDIGMKNLGTMIFADPSQLPDHEPQSYD